MAHFAEIDENNIVLRVLRVDDSEELMWPVPPYSGVWLQTSYNNRIRKNFAGVGYYYDLARDAFIPPQPYPSWVLFEDTCQWVPPVPKPDDMNYYWWDEQALSWVLGSSPGTFVAKKETVGEFLICRMSAQNIGDYAIAVDFEGMNRNAPTRVSLVTKGARTHGPEDGRSQPITLNVGDFNTILPDMLPGVRYKVIALTADTEYYCVSRGDAQELSYQEFSMQAGSSLSIEAGKYALICSEGVVTIYEVSDETKNVPLIASAFGLLFW